MLILNAVKLVFSLDRIHINQGFLEALLGRGCIPPPARTTGPPPQFPPKHEILQETLSIICINADDINLFSATVGGLKSLIDICLAYSSKSGLTWVLPNVNA